MAAVSGLAVALAGTAFVLWRNHDAVDPVVATTPKPTEQPAAQAPVAPQRTADVPPADPSFQLPSRVEPAPGESSEAGLVKFQRAIERDPQDVAALYGAGCMLLNLGRIQESLGPLKQAMVWRPDNGSYAVTYAYAAALAEQWPEAASAFRSARALMPDDATTTIDLALALQKRGDYEGAAREYSDAIELAGDSVAARLGLAICLDRLNRAGEAVDAYRAYLRALPADADRSQVEARIEKLNGGGR